MSNCSGAGPSGTANGHTQISHRRICLLQGQGGRSVRCLCRAGATSTARGGRIRIYDQAFARASPTKSEGKRAEGSREPRNLVGMPNNRYRGPPMTLANMRAQGVRSLWVVCELCHHEAVLNVDGYGDAVPVPAFGPRMVCTSCGIVGAHARPNWQESPTGRQWHC